MSTTATNAPTGGPVSASTAVRPRGVAVLLMVVIQTRTVRVGPRQEPATIGE